MENKVYYGEYSLAHWIELILKKNIILPKYQRYFVWSEDKVKALINDLQNRQFVPSVTIGAFKDGDSNQNLILDGQQRLTSILLAYLNFYPDKQAYKKTIEQYVNDNDDETDDDAEVLDNLLEWTFKTLTDKGSTKEVISKRISTENNYKQLELNISDDFFKNTFLGFSYLVPSASNTVDQQKYYSSVFRNINIQGVALLPQESRASLYFLDEGLAGFFEPDFIRQLVIKGVSGEAKVDFVRYLSLLSQYHNDTNADKLARGYKPQMEKYYEEFIYSTVNDSQSKYGKFSNVFTNKEYQTRFSVLQKHLTDLKVKREFQSIIDLDMHLFGLIYAIVFKNKSIDITNESELKTQLESKIQVFRKDYSHGRAPSNLKHLRARISTSIQIYGKYAS